MDTIARREAEERLRTMLRIARLAEKPAYPVKQVAGLLDVDYETVYRMTANGTLGSFRICGGKRRGQHGTSKASGIRVDWQSLVDLIAEENDL